MIKIIKNSTLALLAAMILLSTTTYAQKSLPQPLPNALDVLFIQVANSGQLIPQQNQPNTYTLILKEVDRFTSYFADRPSRVTGLIPTQDFITCWQQQRDIQQTPPNVAIETTDKDGNRINRVFVLSHPIYDKKHRQMTYTAKLTDNHGVAIEKTSLGYTVLFIDDFNWNGNKFGNN